MYRLFVGLDLPDAIKDRLAGLTHGLPNARWVGRNSFHMTLRFIGEIDGGLSADVETALARVRARRFGLALEGLGVYGMKRDPRAVWVGTEPCPPLEDLQQRIESVLARLGLAPDRRRFSPHITLARLRNHRPEALANFIASHGLFRSEPFEVNTFHLFSSRRGGDGSIYRIEASYGLVAEAHATQE